MKHRYPYTLLALTVALINCMISCSDESSYISDVALSMDKTLHSLDIQNAKIVYGKTSDDNEPCETGYFKLDETGKEKKLVIYNSQGQPCDIEIVDMLKVSSDYLFFTPDKADVKASLFDSDADGINEATSICKITCIVEIKTGKIYNIPYIGSLDNAVAMEENGELYFNNGENDQIFKLDTSSMSVEPILPMGQTPEEFSFNNEGYVAYWTNLLDGTNYKVKSPGNVIMKYETPIYNIDGVFYTIDNGIAYRLETDGNSRLLKYEVCDVPEGLHIYSYIYSDIRKSCLFHASEDIGSNTLISEYECWEFNGKNFTKLEQEIPYGFFCDDDFSSGVKSTGYNLYYVLSNNKLQKLDLSSFAMTSIDLSEYQILNLTDDKFDGVLSFVGIRHSDLTKVVGRIFSDDSVVMESSEPLRGNIKNVISIN